MSFGELLAKTRETSVEGQTWSQAWESIEDDFNALAVVWTPEERLRNFEMILAAFVSDDPHVIEPPGTARFCPFGRDLRINNPWVSTVSAHRKPFVRNTLEVALATLPGEIYNKFTPTSHPSPRKKVRNGS